MYFHFLRGIKSADRWVSLIVGYSGPCATLRRGLRATRCGSPMEKFAVFRPSEGSTSAAPPLGVLGKGCLLDTLALGMHNRTCRSIMGLLVGNSKTNNRPSSRHYFGFNLNFNDVPLGNANALHSHKGLEWFMAYSGDFEIRAGNQGKSKVHLSKGDFILVPPDLNRSFVCIASKDQITPASR